MMKDMHHNHGAAKAKLHPVFTAPSAGRDYIDTVWLEEEGADVEFRRKMDNEGEIVYEIIASC
ncbi:MAG: hypothetical protein KGL10_00085 [Alphaproteobacteria bacterium]|nr:hypothetical protein [Alphaproteobacteria bacterium]MDE2335689.1 hypothetical protein [Alphaproteobacteria bacterium]